MKNTRIRAMLSLVSAFGVFTGSAAWADLIITGVFDGPLPGGNPKGVELYATEDIPDLATYALGVANNGGGTDGVETILPSQSLAAGSFFFVATEDQDFAQWFGSAPGHVGGNGINHNGCDAIELFFDSSGQFSGGEAVVDVFGDIDTDGTGTAWDTVDGWAHRNDGVLANGGNFDASNWTFSGPNAWDGDDNVDGGSDNGTNLTATPPYPAGTFSLGAEPLVPATDVDVIASQTAFDAFYGVNVLTGSTTWTSDKIYILTDRVYVKEDQVLTIEPGTKVYGTFDDNGTAGNFSDDKVGAVIVARGGQLVADGTLEAPIVFDAIQSLEAVRGEDHPWDVDAVAGPAPTRETGGLWGGLIMLGSAYIAHTDSNGVNIGNNIIEGFLPATAVDNDSDGRDDILEYGFDETFARDDADNSGVVRYVSIRHGGYEVGDGNEINGLTLGGVGTGTVIEHVEVVSNQDDGIEFFGGTVNTSYISMMFNQDDSFDIDEGHTGTHQFWFAVQNPNSADNGGEWDGVTGGSKSSTDASVTRSAPQIYNATFVGAGPGITGSDKGNNAFLLDDYFAANVQNSVFHDFAEAFVEVKSDGEGGFSASNNTIGAFGDYDGANNGSVLDAPVAFLGSNPFFSVTGTPINGHTNAGTDPGFSAYTRDGSGYLTSIDPRPATDSSPRTDDVSAGAPAAAAYRGAFGDTNWLLGWTWADAQGLVADAFVAEPLALAKLVNVYFDENGEGNAVLEGLTPGSIYHVTGSFDGQNFQALPGSEFEAPAADFTAGPLALPFTTQQQPKLLIRVVEGPLP